jgi:hypothetical protein
VGAELFYVDRQTDIAKLIVAFRNFANASNKCNIAIYVFKTWLCLFHKSKYLTGHCEKQTFVKRRGSLTLGYSRWNRHMLTILAHRIPQRKVLQCLCKVFLSWHQVRIAALIVSLTTRWRVFIFMSRQLCTSLPPRKEAEWAPRVAWTFWRREEKCCPCLVVCVRTQL